MAKLTTYEQIGEFDKTESGHYKRDLYKSGMIVAAKRKLTSNEEIKEVFGAEYGTPEFETERKAVLERLRNPKPEVK